jgi:hypothetical protein
VQQQAAEQQAVQQAAKQLHQAHDSGAVRMLQVQGEHLRLLH